MKPAPSRVRGRSAGRRRVRSGAVWLGLCAAGGALAQSAAPAPPAVSRPTPAAAAAPAPADAVRLERVEVTGAPASDTEQRRRSTAAKTVYGRDEIDRYGDSTLGEVLRRLPGVTLQGAPGRGGNIRLRGLGNGYTQMLLDGERMPPGFSLDTLTPEQVERIEIYRAPTAETGARAIAGTINIITREGFRRRINDLKVTALLNNGRLSPSVSWTRNDSVGAWTWNTSLSAFRYERASEAFTDTVDRPLGDLSSVSAAQRETTYSRDHRSGIHLTSRLQWRREGGESLSLTPFLIASTGGSRSRTQLEQTAGADVRRYDRAASDDTFDYALARLNGQWLRRLGDGRLETRFGLGFGSNPSDSRRTEYDAAGRLIRTLDSRSSTRDRSANGTLKYTTLLAAGHDLVAGVEAETTRRDETYTTLQDGTPILVGLAGDVAASTARLAAYAQDEWTVTPQWAAHAGLRWEGIQTRSTDNDGSERRNTSSVWSPLLHAVWKPAPQSRDQVRLSLTRSYRSPPLQQLVARPVVSTRYPLSGPNLPTAPDRVGNPDLKPELATGLDLAVERYLPAGGVLSASVFHRRIANVIRQLVSPAEETVPYAKVPRYVSRPANVGDAITQGIELEAKFRLDTLAVGAPPVDLRGNVSFYRSRVSSVDGPDNRLDQQPGMSANLGADWKLRSLPLTLGGNIGWTPAYDTRLSTTQTAFQGRKRVIDLNALWVFDPALQLRLSATNLGPLDYVTAGSVDTATLRETATVTGRSYTSWQLRLEMKL